MARGGASTPSEGLRNPIRMRGIELPHGVEWTGKRVMVVHPVVWANNSGDTVPGRAGIITHGVHTAETDGSRSGPVGSKGSRKPDPIENQ